MGVIMDELQDFCKNIKKFNDIQRDTFLQECVKELAARLLVLVIKATPVGKKPKIDVRGNKAEGIIEIWAGYSGGELRRAWTVRSPKKTAYGWSIEVENTKDYASYVEYGHVQTPGRYVPALGKKLKKSFVKGKFMLTKSVSELEKDVGAILNQKLERELKKIL